MFKSWFPRWTRPLVEKGIYAFMDNTLIVAFGFPQPSPFMRRMVELGLRTRARVLRLFPRRSRPLLRTEMTHPTYPDGYQIDTLGPPGAGAG